MSFIFLPWLFGGGGGGAVGGGPYFVLARGKLKPSPRSKMAALARNLRINQFLKLFQSCSGRRLVTQASEKCFADIKCSPLRKRGLLKLKGRDTVKFLQGLVTNDVETFQLEAERKAMYAFFLNSSGRALYDVFLYKHGVTEESPAFFLECDVGTISDLMKHLKMFKLRSKVDISRAEDCEPWVIFSSSGAVDLQHPSARSDMLVLEEDPRVKLLGFRMVLPKGSSPCVCFDDMYETGDTFDYDVHRAKLGVCEGVDEIPPGNAMPLEYNIGYLNGGKVHTMCPKRCILPTTPFNILASPTIPVGGSLGIRPSLGVRVGDLSREGEEKKTLCFPLLSLSFSHLSLPFLTETSDTQAMDFDLTTP